MTGKIFVDTAPYIYVLEDNPSFSDAARQAISRYSAEGYGFVTSAVTYMEFCTIPYRKNCEDKVLEFERFLLETRTDVIAIDSGIAKQAARIRAKYNSIKGMDALQIAVAICSDCTLFFTNDKRLEQVAEIDVVTINSVE